MHTSTAAVDGVEFEGELQAMIMPWKDPPAHSPVGPSAATEPAAQLENFMELRDICCPACGNAQKVGSSKLRTQTGFSNILCQRCLERSRSNKWRCRCRLLWTKCPRHLHTKVTKTRRTPKVMSLKDKRNAVFGVVRPLPSLRSRVGDRTSSPQRLTLTTVGKVPNEASEAQGVFFRVKFKLGGNILASRFPQLVKTNSPT